MNIYTVYINWYITYVLFISSWLVQSPVGAVTMATSFTFIYFSIFSLYISLMFTNINRPKCQSIWQHVAAAESELKVTLVVCMCMHVERLIRQHHYQGTVGGLGKTWHRGMRGKKGPWCHGTLPASRRFHTLLYQPFIWLRSETLPPPMLMLQQHSLT